MSQTNPSISTASEQTPTQRYKLIFYIPPKDLQAAKEAIFATGAGSYPGQGNYTEVCFTTPGIGQFRPGSTANPHIGTPGELEEVGEVKVEILCVGQQITRAAVAALKQYADHVSQCIFNAEVSACILITSIGHIRTRSLLTKCTRWKTFDRQSHIKLDIYELQY